MSYAILFTDIAAADVGLVEGSIEDDGGTSDARKQSDGRFTLVATFPGTAQDVTPVDGTDEFEWMTIARAEIGQREGNSQRIREYSASTSGGAQADSVPWCSSFVNFCMVESGIVGTNSMSARSWLTWGQECNEFLPGCVVVLRRGAAPNGHVGFFAGMLEDKKILLLGGNQSDSVSIAGFPIDQVLGRRFPTGAEARFRAGSFSVPERWNDALAIARTNGASAATAVQDHLAARIEASRAMASKDVPRAVPIMGRFIDAGARYLIPPALLAAIASRESRVGGVLWADGFGTDGNAYGIMQIDRRSHALRGEAPSSSEHILQAAEILASYRSQMLSRHQDWSDERILRAAVAAYNCGPGRITDSENPDSLTTGGDYSSDVVARARVFANMH